ncbi:hypothetical protein D9611_011151 [Ephemerocybe angulata]|uniref:Uncharacterized protein n=1 Tax=Ephemerocybe angulata TaxID=980116 RepID=A0A8H5CER5_9AGAR|nr:hypothetical protein D9611_011151 [Tulosesus angulatus]
MKYTSVLGGSQWFTVGSVALPAPSALEEDDEETIMPHHIVRAPVSPTNEEQEYIRRALEEGAIEDEGAGAVNGSSMMSLLASASARWSLDSAYSTSSSSTSIETESSLPPPDWYFETDLAALFTPSRDVKATLVPFASSKASDAAKEEVPTYSVQEISGAASRAKANPRPTRPKRFFSIMSPFEVVRPGTASATPITSTLPESLTDPSPTSTKRSVIDVEEMVRKTSPKPTHKAHSKQIDGLPAPSTGRVSDAARLIGVNSPPTRPERYFSVMSPFEVASPGVASATPITSTLSKSLTEPSPTSTKLSVIDVEETTTPATSSSAPTPSVAKSTLEPPDPKQTASEPVPKARVKQRVKVTATTYIPPRSKGIDGLPERTSSTGGLIVAARSKGVDAKGLGGIDGQVSVHRRTPVDGALGVCPVPGSAIEAVRNYQLPPHAMRRRRSTKARVVALFRKA